MEEERRCKHCGGMVFHGADVVFCPVCFRKFRAWLKVVDEKVRSYESASIFNEIRKARSMKFPGRTV